MGCHESGQTLNELTCQVQPEGRSALDSHVKRERVLGTASGFHSDAASANRDPEWERALRCVDETCKMLADLMQQVQWAAPEERPALLAHLKILKNAPRYVNALAYLEGRPAEQQDPRSVCCMSPIRQATICTACHVA